MPTRAGGHATGAMGAYAMLDTVTPGRAAAELVKGIKVIDVDTHLSEPHDLWTSRAPAKWKDLVPQVKKDANGNPLWVIDGDRSMGVGSACSVVHAGGRH